MRGLAMKVMVKNKTVGEVVGDTFYKKILGSKHLLRKPPAIAFDTTSLIQAQRYGATMIRVLDKESNIVYESTFEYLKEQGFDINRKYGKQRALMLGDWTIDSIREIS
jgi:hypothetical protein